MQNFIAGLFALGVLISLAGGFIGLIAPSIFRFRKAVNPSRRKIALVSLASFIAFLAAFSATMPEPTPEERAKAASEEKGNRQLAQEASKLDAKTPVPLSVTAEELDKEFDDNVLAARDKYSNLPLRITGTVSEISEGAYNLTDLWNGSGVVKLNGRDSFNYVYAFVPKKASVKHLHKADTITLECGGAEDGLLSTRVTNCTIMERVESM